LTGTLADIPWAEAISTSVAAEPGKLARGDGLACCASRRRKWRYLRYDERLLGVRAGRRRAISEAARVGAETAIVFVQAGGGETGLVLCLRFGDDFS
jgi:hypothetical protein